MIRVAFLSPSVGLGGAEMFIRTLCRHFERCKPVGLAHLGTMVDPWMRAELARCVPIQQVHGEEFAVRQCVESVCSSADVLISWGFSALDLVTKNLDIPVVEVSHGSYEWEDNVRLLEKSYGGATHWVGVSETARKAFPEEVRDRAEVIYNGVELDRVTPRIGRDKQRELWGIPKDGKVALYLGRFCPMKGPQRLIQAVPYLPGEWRAVLVGDGPKKNDPFTNTIKRDASDRVLFFPAVHHVGDALAAADVVVMPSECEGMPLGMVEAWLAGVPVVSTGHAWANEANERNHGMIRFLVPLDTEIENLAIGIRAAAKPIDPERVRTIAEIDYSATAMAQRWEAYLTRIVREWEDRGKAKTEATKPKVIIEAVSVFGAEQTVVADFPTADTMTAPTIKKPAKLRIGMYPFRIAGKWMEDVYNTYLHHAEASGIEYVMDSTNAVDAILVDFRRVKELTSAETTPIIIEKSQGGPHRIDSVAFVKGSSCVLSHCKWRTNWVDGWFLGLGFGALTRLQPLRVIGASGPRPVDVSFVGTATYTNKVTHKHRQAMMTAANALTGCKTEIVGRDKEAGNKLPMTVPEYFQSLLRAKIALSPLGLGDCCHRDYEAIMAGCVMVGPDRDGIEAWPDIYRSGEMYVKCAKDHSDLQEVVDGILSNWDKYDDWRRGNRAWLIEETQPWRVARRIRRTFEKCLARSS